MKGTKKMNQYKVDIDYLNFVFDEGEAALSFAEVARRHIITKKVVIKIEIEDIRTEEGEEDGR